MEAFTLLELNEHIRRVIALNFQETVWVQCEIAQVKSSRGHYYLDLIEKSPDHTEVLAQMNAVIWAKTAWLIQRKLKDVFQELLQDGMETRLKVRVDFHERYGIKLIIDDIDPSFTLGNVELRRREMIEKLSAMGLLRQNARHKLPLVIQRIAVLSAQQAAGYHDFRKHLFQNSQRFRYWIDLYPIAMQGIRVETELVNALERIGHARKHYDCVVIIRGGGSRIDLSAFDSFAIGKAIAEFPLPVFTGIGHEIDNTVADSVAHTSLKTPTAVADFLLELNSRFAFSVNQLFLDICSIARRSTQSHRQELRHLTELMRRAPRELLLRNTMHLQQIAPALLQTSKTHLHKRRDQVAHVEMMIGTLDPASVLQRGFSITVKNGKRITSSSETQEGDVLMTYLSEGRVQSKVLSHEQQ